MFSIKLALAYFRRRKLRAVLTIITVTVAVAALVAVQGLNDSIDYVAGELASLLGGKAQLEVKGPQVGMSDSLLAKVKSTDGVKISVPFVHSAAQVEELPGFTDIMGIETGEDEKIRTYQIAQGHMPAAGHQEIVVPKELVRGKFWQIGDTWRIQTMQGMQDFKLVGILEDSGVARANAGAVVFMPMDTAQKAFALEGKISSISIVLQDPDNLSAVQKTLQDKLGTSVEVQTPSGRSKDIDKTLELIMSMDTIYGFMGLFMALFVMYNSMRVAVSDQRSQIGILRALGWRRRETSRLILTEALLIGVVGSSLGLFLGIYLAQGLLSTVSESLRELSKISIPRIQLTATTYTITWLTGVLSCLIAAWLPARKATSIVPIEAMSRQYSRVERGYPLWRVAVGALLIIGSWLIVVYSSYMPLVPVAFIGLIVGTAVLMPPLLIFILRGLELLAGRFLGLTGRLGVSTFRLSPKRSVLTGMPILLGLAVTFGFLGIIASFNQTLVNWVKVQISSDIIIAQGLQSGASGKVALPEELLDRVRKVSGVKVAAGTRSAGFNWEGNPIDIAVFEVPEWRKFTNPPVLELGKEQALNALQRGGQIWISQSLALKYGLSLGQKLTIPTPTGPVQFPIAAITQDYFSYNGTVHMNREDYIKYWSDRSIDYIYVSVEQGVAPALVRDRLEGNLKGDYRVTVSLASDYRDSILKLTSSIINIFNIVLLVALLVAAVGTANSLLMSVMERVREIGTLRSVGLKRGQIISMFLIEVGALLIAGLILSIPIGAIIQASGTIFYKNALGWVLEVNVPWAKNIGTIIVMFVVALLSAIYPAWLASKVDPVEALRSE